jgi:Fur family ferric uptake transcriptional regulator
MSSYQNILQRFKDLLKNNQLKFTKQREEILKALFNSKTHLSSEELYKSLETKGVGIATVYRTLSLLENEKIATTFTNNGIKYYELKKEHHDHIICSQCGKVEEFLSPEIEELQEKIALSLGFEITNHSLQIFGICKECQISNQTNS